jgi:DNA polymerase III alpha subunit
MKYDKLGIAYADTEELCELLYQNPDLDIANIFVEDPYEYNNSVKTFYADLPTLKLYNLGEEDIEKFDAVSQEFWSMPEEYKDMDIAKWLLDQCKTPAELQRVGEELLLYQERDLFLLLRQLKYIVDIWRQKDIVWGVGRGSSVASYVLYLIGVHRINSIYYDLDIAEFLR